MADDTGMRQLGRFQRSSDGLQLSRMLADTRWLTAWCYVLAVSVLSGGAAYFLVAHKERPAPPPAMTRLIIRKPRSSKQFVLKRQRLRPPRRWEPTVSWLRCGSSTIPSAVATT